MHGIYILAAVILILIGIAQLRIRIRLVYNENGVSACLFVLCFKFPLYPKGKKVKVQRYTYKKYRKRLLAQRKKEQEAAPQSKASQKKSKPKKSLRDSLRLYTYLLKKMYARFLHHFRIDVARLRITVATGDAAQTAIAYGIVCQTAEYAFELLENHTNFHKAYRADCAITPDFVGEKSSVSCNISFSLRVFEIADLGIRFFYHYLVSRMRRPNSQANKEDKTWQKAN